MPPPKESRTIPDHSEYPIFSGSDNLRTLLTCCDDPIEAIQTFQAEPQNSIQLPTLYPALKLLDLHGVRRADYHELVLKEVKDRLLSRLMKLGEQKSKESQKTLEQQLERCFSLYKQPHVLPIVLRILSQLNKVPENYLQIISADVQFYNSSSITVRQQIWLKNDNLFLQAVEPLIESYVEKKEKLLRNIEASSFFDSETTKSRRQWMEVQELMQIVGEQEPLYRRLVQIIGDRHAHSANNHLCSLRLEMIMAAHDQNNEIIVKTDRCHEFAWCMDACLRDRHLDNHQAHKLRSILDRSSRPPNSAETWHDLALVAADPHVVHFLSSMAVKLLKESVLVQGRLPRELSILQLLMRLLSLGANTVSLSRGDRSGPPSVDCIVFTNFLAELTSLMAEDILHGKFSSAEDTVADLEIPLFNGPSESMENFVRTDASCASVFLHYLLELSSMSMMFGISDDETTPGWLRYLPILTKCKNQLEYSDEYLHLLGSRLINGNSRGHVTRALLEDFILSGPKDQMGIKYQALRIVQFLHGTIGEQCSNRILNKLHPENFVRNQESTKDRLDLTQYTHMFQKVIAKLDV